MYTEAFVRDKESCQRLNRDRPALQPGTSAALAYNDEHVRHRGRAGSGRAMDRRGARPSGGLGVRPNARGSGSPRTGAVTASLGRATGAWRVAAARRGRLLHRGLIMAQWPATRANRVLAALLRIGWSIKR